MKSNERWVRGRVGGRGGGEGKGEREGRCTHACICRLHYFREAKLLLYIQITLIKYTFATR